MTANKESPKESALNDFRDDLPNEVKQAIKMAKVELDGGEGIPHDEVMAEIKNRFLKS